MRIEASITNTGNDWFWKIVTDVSVVNYPGRVGGVCDGPGEAGLQAAKAVREISVWYWNQTQQELF